LAILIEDEAVESAPEGSIKNQVRRGLRWSLAGVLVTKMASFAIGLILARILIPADFGVYAVAMAATGFLIHVNDAGIIAATVQWRGRLEDVAPTAAILAFVSSVGLYAISWVAAPWLADLTSSPTATPVIRILTAVIVIDGITAVRSAALMRRFQQDKLTMANAGGFVVQAVLSVVLAMAGAGALSFAVGQLAGAVVVGVLVIILAKVPFEVGLDWVIARKLLRFGLPLAASLGVEAILVNADYVIVGRLLGATALGFYLLAFNVSSWVPGIVTTGVRYVSIAGFSRLAEKEGSLAAGVYQAVPMMVTLILPITVLTALLSAPLVAFLYGATWAPAAPALFFLMILMAARVLISLVFDILTSAGATRATLWLNLAWAAALIPALIIGVHLDGIRGAAAAHALIAMVVAIPLATFLLHREGVRLAPMGAAVVRPFVGGAVASATCLLALQVMPGIPIVQLVVAGGAGLLSYLLVVLPRGAISRRLTRSTSMHGDRPNPDSQARKESDSVKRPTGLHRPARVQRRGHHRRRGAISPSAGAPSYRARHLRQRLD
jgi:PST family polysaccharide transporter